MSAQVDVRRLEGGGREWKGELGTGHQERVESEREEGGRRTGSAGGRVRDGELGSVECGRWVGEEQEDGRGRRQKGGAGGR